MTDDAHCPARQYRYEVRPTGDRPDIVKIRACLLLVRDTDDKVTLTGASARLVADVIGAAEIVTTDTGNNVFREETHDAWNTLRAAFAAPFQPGAVDS